MFAAITGFSLASAAGLNAYIPLLIVGLLGRYTHVLTLTGSFSWLTNGWVLTLLAVLLAAEMVLDKVAVIDSVNDAVQTLVRPAAGGAAFAATSAAARLDSSVNSSGFMHHYPWLGWGLGIATAFVVHLTKSSARPLVNTATLGTGAPVVSAAEDLVAVVMSILALIAPLLALVALLIMVGVGLRVVRRVLRRRRRRRGARLQPSVPRAR